MHLLLASEEDPASMNIRSKVLEYNGWTDVGVFRGKPVFERAGSILATIPGIHLYSDNIDLEVEEQTGRFVDEVIFLSRHKAASGIPTLTVHPIGNYGKAEYGGTEGHIVPNAGRTMTGLLRQMSARISRLPEFKASFEVTHHGPIMSRPTCFIEIGSSENEWGNDGAGEIIAASIMDLEVEADPLAIGIGGGHYAPRFTEVSLSKRIAFGHMIPNYAMENAADERIRKMMADAARASGTNLAFIHRKSMSKPRATHLRELAEMEGLSIIDSDDLASR